MNTIAFVVPPYEEQVRIAAFLDRKCAEIDAVIERTKATIEEYRKLRQAIVTDAVTKGVRGERALKDTGVEWIRIVPVDWEMVRGKGLFVETNTRSTTGEEELLTVSQYTGVTPRSQKNVNMFEAESLEGYKICKVGDIAANTMWLWAGAIGVSEHEGVISPSYNLYRQSGENYNPKYLDYLLRCTPLVQCYESMSTGIRASRLRLYQQQFLSIKFPVPPMAEQVEIVVYLDKKCAEMDALIARKTALLTEMESYKKSVIYEYVTGKKEVV
jgi:type I restriction enzyme S subunit